MKFSKLSQVFLVSSIGLLVASLLTACQIVTIDYVFVASSVGIETYAVDSQSGALRAGAPVVTTGVNSPVAMTATTDYANLYLANKGDNTVVHYAVGIYGVLTKKDTITLGGTPVSLAVNTAGTALYVITGPSPAVLTAYSLSSGTIGSQVASAALTIPGYGSDTVVPTGVAVLANNGTNILGSAVYVTAYDQSAYNPTGTATSTANPGWVFGYVIGSGGALTPASNSPYEAGVQPSGVTTDPTDRFVYVTDFASNELIGYTILDGSTLEFMTNGPFRTGSQPSAITIDTRGKYIYVANELDSSVSAYALTIVSGTPTAVVNTTGAAINTTDTSPVAIAVDPALGRFVLTANYEGSSVSGFSLDPNSGALTVTQASPYPTGSKPTALVIVPHGNHSTQAINP